MHTYMDIPALYEVFLNHMLISTDTRKIQTDCIFFALRGENFNGNEFAEEALAKGAAWAVVDDEKISGHPRFIRVKHVLETLQQLAAWHRRTTGFKILAITGSNGKTTTKELCRAILAKKYITQATQGNLNNHIGVPLTLLSMDAAVQVAIVEMGANHPGEIMSLCEMVQPDYGLITNIGKAHLEGFGGIEGVARAKGELLTHLVDKGKTLFINQGDGNVNRLIPENYKNCIYYNGDKGIYGRNIQGNPFLEMEIITGDHILELKTQLIGRFNAENILAACSTGLHMGISEEEIVQAVQNYRPQDYRSQFIRTDKNRIYMDAYNANPSSMMASVSEFLSWRDENKLLILGEMKEVGDQSVHEHEAMISFLKSHKNSDVICIGRSFRIPARDSGYLHFSDVENLLDHFKRHPVTDRFIFIKGSRSNRLENLLEVL